MFGKKGVLKNFENFTGKYLCQIWEIFKNTFFYRTPPVDASALYNSTVPSECKWNLTDDKMDVCMYSLFTFGWQKFAM